MDPVYEFTKLFGYALAGGAGLCLLIGIQAWGIGRALAIAGLK